MTTIEKIKAGIAETLRCYDVSTNVRFIIFKIIDKYAEQDPCDDVVSRQAVLEKAIYVPIAKVMKDELLEYCEVICRKVVFVDDIEQLPPVRPQEQTGHWIETDDKYGAFFICDKCHRQSDIMENFCPNCGCRMVEPKVESEDVINETDSRKTRRNRQGY